LERIELIPLHAAVASPELPRASAAAQTRTNKVFVVHGHDEAAKTGLEIFLREVGLEPVVLHRQADEGLTVIEKFEKHGDVGYAFVLLTPDDIGYAAGEDAKSDEARAKERRARQNVIFEFGYFVGKLSRSRVCCLYRGDVTLPSDLGGLVYKKYQSSVEEVALPILRDLKAAGYAVSL
jgi:predicted nucleotide-binding protein